MRNKQVRWVSCILMLITMIIIFFLSAQSPQDSYRVSEKFSRVIKAERTQTDGSQISEEIAEDSTDNAVNTNYFVFGFLNTRKLAHMLAYFALAIFTYGCFVGRRKIIFVLAMDYFYACTDEFHQYLIGRTGSFVDTLFDAAGILLAVGLCELVYRIILKKTKNTVRT